MSKIEGAVREVHRMESLAEKDQWINRIYPLVKLILTIIYIATVVSFGKYQISRLLLMGIYPIVIFVLGEISFRDALRRLRFILPLVCVAGLFNPLFDRQIFFYVGKIKVTGGMVSMATLLVKGAYSVFASYLLIATTSIEKICFSLRKMHVPAAFVTQLLLTYRYISVLLEEAGRITQAYCLRAPRQKGVHFKVWGSLTGQLLLRSIDRASQVYESMLMRGYQGEFRYVSARKCKKGDWFYLLAWLAVFAVLRLV